MNTLNLHTHNTLFSNQNLSIIFYTTDGIIKTWNKGAEKLFGYDSQEIVGQHISNLYLSKKTAEELLFNLLNGNPNYEVEQARTHKNGKIIWTRLFISPIWNEKSLDGFTELSIDISEKIIAEKELERREKLLSEAQKIAHIGNWEWDIKNDKVEWSDELYRIYGFEPEEIQIDLGTFLSLVHPDSRESTQGEIRKAIENKSSFNFFEKIVRPSGELRLLHSTGTVILDENNEVIKLMGSCLDITEERRRQEILEIKVKERTIELETVNEKLQREISERKRAQDKIYHLGRVLESSKNEIYMFDSESLKFSMVNSGARKNLGYSMEELFNLTTIDLKPEFSEESFRRMIEPLLNESRQELIFETIHKRKDGSFYNVEVNLQLSKFVDPPVFVAIINDITERKKAEEQIRNSLNEKEVLIKEIHHRVKNNLQIVNSLLSLQSNYINDNSVLEILKESMNRIRTMSLIHEKLYQNKNFLKINFSEYLSDLTSYLLFSYSTDKTIRLLKEVEDISIKVDLALNLGLIINELISNSLKHAFVNGKDGEIKINLKRKSNQDIELQISDNGMGFPDNFNFEENDSLGLQLVNTLVDQIGGKINLKSNNGAFFQITFPCN